MSKEEKLLNEWVERLGLQDWAIALRYDCELEDLNWDNACATTNFESTTKTAIIRMVKPELATGRLLDYDFEQTLVHELMHVKLTLLAIEPNSLANSMLELAIHQLVDDLARALVMAKRGETKRKLAVKKVKPMGK